MKNKFKDLILSICSMISIQVIFSDLGWSHEKSIGWKYLFAVVMGLVLTFYVKPQAEKIKAEIKQ